MRAHLFHTAIAVFYFYVTMNDMKKIVIGNWKMNPKTLRDAVALAKSVEKNIHSSKAEVVLTPPFPFIDAVSKVARRSKLGAQDIFWEAQGAYTGEISANQLQSLGVKYVIVGHSERRALGETNEIVRKKLHAGLKAGIKTVLCVGEAEHNPHDAFPPMVRDELYEALRGIQKSVLKDLVIAYEPIWAVGTGKPATPKTTFEISILIRRELFRMFGKKRAMQIPILYGGSVTDKDAASFIIEGRADGLLVGGASLKYKMFSKIIEAISKI